MIHCGVRQGQFMLVDRQRPQGSTSSDTGWFFWDFVHAPGTWLVKLGYDGYLNANSVMMQKHLK